MYSELISIIVNLLIAMLIPTAVVLGLTYINRNSKELLVRKYGFSSQIWLGCVGIFIHECSHAVMALIFGHNIVEFKPLILPRNVARNDGALGYVRQTWNANSTYQNMGNLFIGTAPIWGCTLAIYWVLKTTMPNVYQLVLSLEKAATSYSMLKVQQVIANPNLFANMDMTSIVTMLIGLIIIANIVIGGFDLSPADLHNAFGAFIALYLIVLVILSVLTFLGLGSMISAWLLKIMTAFVLLMSLSLVLSVAINLVLRFLNFFI
ncbi:MAG: hypothetical protein N4R48_03360 [Lactobacillus crispatus]|nr:hypothetical protein [Lactobacillus crispatus]